jgi:hypothetical protein
MDVEHRRNKGAGEAISRDYLALGEDALCESIVTPFRARIIKVVFIYLYNLL